jgi:hypothetical protein
MSIWVHARGAYRADVGSKWRQEDYLVRNFVKSLKGEKFNGYSDFDLNGKTFRITHKNPGPAYDAWSDWAVSRVRDELKLGPVTLVPVPSSAQTEFQQDTCPVRMAERVARDAPDLCSVGYYLRHAAARQSAHGQGGSRHPDEIERALRCAPVDTRRPVVLIDDVVTTGGHLKACARVLREQGVEVEYAIVAARTVWQAVPAPLTVEAEDIEAVKAFDLDEFLS